MDSYSFRRYLTKNLCNGFRTELDDLRLPDDLPAEHEFDQENEEEKRRRLRMCPAMSVKLHTALMILAGGRVTQRGSKNDIRKQMEAILLNDFKASRKFFATDVGSRFSVRAKNYRSLLLTRYILEEAVNRNAAKNKYAHLFQKEFFDAPNKQTEFEMAMPYLFWFSVIEPFYEKTKKVTSTISNILDEFETLKFNLESLRDCDEDCFNVAIRLIKASEV